jgi:hypothetical protein
MSYLKKGYYRTITEGGTLAKKDKQELQSECVQIVISAHAGGGGLCLMFGDSK